MKRYLLLILCIILFTSCNSNDMEEISIQDSKIEEIDVTAGKELFSDIKEHINIIYFDSKQILFNRDGEINKKIDATEKLFYHYNLENNITTYITNVKYLSFSTEDIALLNNHIYYPLSIKNEQGSIEHILEISLDDFSSKLVKSSVIDSCVTKLKASSNMIFRYYQRDLGVEETDFYIDNLGVLDSENNIIYKKYVDYTGEILVNINIYEDSIYSYSLVCGEKIKYVVREYSLSGDVLNEYQLNLEEFIKLDDDDYTDIVYEIIREGKYIILSTLNGRVKICEIVDNKLIDIETPKEFDETFGARVIDNNGDSDGNVYFRSTDDNNKFYIFDTEKGTFKKYILVSDEFLPWHVIRDSSGNIIVVTIKDDESRYFLINLP